MSFIRDNRSVIIGLTGYLGSGCTSLARHLAFDFSKEINDAYRHDDSYSKIEYLYERLEELTKNPGELDHAKGVKHELKAELEKREILNVARRNKLEFRKPFFYIPSVSEKDYVCFKDCFRGDGGKSKGLVHCLALHAEENAILQLARYNSAMPAGGTIFTTAFPCPLCLKKISQVGLSRIIYTESYSNPIISKILEKTTKEIETISFEGVKYYSYFKLFKPYYDRKEQQQLLRGAGP